MRSRRRLSRDLHPTPTHNCCKQALAQVCAVCSPWLGGFERLTGHTGRNWGQARPEHRRPDQRQTSEIPFGFVLGTGQARFGRTGVSGSVACVSRRGLGYMPGRTRGAPLAGVRLRQHEHQRPTLVLLASRWKPQKHKNGSICKTAADASKPKAFLAGVESTRLDLICVWPSSHSFLL